MSIAVALITAALGNAPAPAVRVLASSDTRLELEVRLRTPIAQWPAPATAESRLISFERSDPAKPWRVDRGLADGEVAGEGALSLPRTMPEGALRVLGESIGDSAGSDVTLIDLIEGDVAICVWRGGDVAEVYFADPLIPTTLSDPRATARSDRLERLATAKGSDGAPQVRGALIAAHSARRATASFGRAIAAAGAVRFEGSRATCDLEACAAMVAQIQPEVDVTLDAPVLLSSAIARWFDRPAPGARAAAAE
jgi:hypothetical protein